MNVSPGQPPLAADGVYAGAEGSHRALGVAHEPVAGGEVAVMGRLDKASHGGEIERARVVLDQAVDAERLLGGPVELVGGKTETRKRRRDADRREQPPDLLDGGARHLGGVPPLALEAKCGADLGHFG